jgi:alanine dehydrogenase
MKIAVFKTSTKENEKRLPLFPEHLNFLDKEVKSHLYFEKGYGIDFGYADDELGLAEECFLSRERLFTECDILLLPKPTISDMENMHPGQILWGWAHCVQQSDITQVAIDKKLTIIAWEEMHHWQDNHKLLHIFYKNNEIAGYAAVFHILELLGIDGLYGPRRKVTIISYGSVSRGAIYALHGRGFNNIHVYSRRPPHLIADQNPDVYYYHLVGINNEYYYIPVLQEPKKFINELAQSDIIINGILQDPLNPAIFLKNTQIGLLKRNTVIIDISCDKGMAFEFAVPTTFNKPVIHFEKNITYYSVDHVPSYLWNAATREISKALTPFLVQLVKDDFDYRKQITLMKAIEIENGRIINKNITSFQKRSEIYPFKYLN